MINGYIKADGKRIIDGNNSPLLLKGVGLGGWLLPEGYMWKFPTEGDRPRKMEAFITGCIGEEAAEKFWNQYYTNFISESDIRRISEEGFNSVRLPFNARHLLSDNGMSNEVQSNTESETKTIIYESNKYLAQIDRVIDLCEQYNLYVVLDMHGAPGGQTGTNIDDSRRDLPELYTDEGNQETMIFIWRFLANRYKHRYIIAGYDLLNEPLPDWFSEYNHKVMPLYKRTIEAIRSVDKDHMIILEGVHWSTDWSVFDVMPDDNIMLQFHRYWNNPDVESVEQFLKVRERLNVPIYMGEGGENNLAWYVGAFHLYTSLDISWNFWTYKKIANHNSLCSITMPIGWDIFIEDIKAGRYTNKKQAQSILNQFAENIKFENCTYYAEVVNALYRRLPLRIPAVFYDFDGVDKGHHFEVFYESQTEYRISDGMNIQFMYEGLDKAFFAHTNGENLSESHRLMIQLSRSEWVSYQVNVTCEGYYFLDIYIKGEKGSKLNINIGDTYQLDIDIENEQWKILRIDKNLLFELGLHTIRFEVVEGVVGLEWFSISNG